MEIPAALLRKGVNVLAVEVRASQFHPIILTWPVQQNWCDLRRSWPHAHVGRLELRSTAADVSTALARPAGVQVWAADMHHRVHTTDFRPPGEKAGKIVVVGARNGTYGAQIVVGTDKPLSGLSVAIGELKAIGGASLPAGAVPDAWGFTIRMPPWFFVRA